MKYLLSFLLAALLSITATAQGIKKSDLANKAWKMNPKEGMVMAGQDVIIFNDSLYMHNFYWVKTGQRATFNLSPYYLSNKEEKSFDDSKVGKETQGSWLVTKSKDGTVTNDKIILLEDSIIRIIQQNSLSFDYKPITGEELNELESKIENDITRTLNTLINAINQETGVRTIFADSPGHILHGIANIPEEQFLNIEKLRICGPLNGSDISALHYLLGENTKFSNIKTLDLSRTWIVSDTVIYNTYGSNFTHEEFMKLRGKRSKLMASEIFGNIPGLENVQGSFDRLQDKYGYVTEIQPDSIYISQNATIADVITREMFADMPYIEHIMLPESAKAIGFRAMANCLMLKDVTIPKSVKKFDAGVFTNDTSLDTVRVYEGSPLLKSVFFDFKNEDKTAFYHCKEDVKIKTYNDTVPKVTFRLHIKERPGKRGSYHISDFTTPGLLAKGQYSEDGKIDLTLTAPRHCMVHTHGDLSYSVLAEEGADCTIDFVHDTIYGGEMTNRLQSYARPMYKLSLEIAKDKRVLSHEFNPDTIKALKAKIDAKQEKFNKMVIKAYFANRDNTIAADLLCMFDEKMSKSSVLGLLALMNERNAFNSATRFAWKRIKEITATNDIDWNEYADTAQMEKIHLMKAGTLRAQKSDKDWTQVQRLYVSGPMNDDDILWLRELVRYNAATHDYNSRLCAIDISDAQIASLPDSAFAYTAHLKYISLPKTIRETGDACFYNSPIMYVTLPEGLKRINKKTFSHCGQIKSIDIPDSVTFIEYGVFQQCLMLRSVKLPAQLDSIAGLVFSRCPLLTALHFPACTRFIGSNLYKDCTELKITIDSANENYEVIENQIVGKTKASREKLGQKAVAPIITKDNNASSKNKKQKLSLLQKIPMGSKLVSHYKMVNGKKVLIGREVK